MFAKKQGVWTFALELNALEENRPNQASANGSQILIFKKGGEIYATGGKCPHLGCMLFAGSLDGYTLKCPCHDWRFDIRTGQFLDAPEIKLPSYPVKIEGQKIFVRL